MQVKVQLVKNYDPNKLKLPCLVSVKLDGVRGRLVGGKLYSRRGNRLIGLEHIENQFIGCNEEIDGELTVPGLEFDEASGIIRNFENAPEVVYNIFDVPSMTNTTLNFRRDRIKSWFREGALGSSTIKFVEAVECNTIAKLKNFYGSALESGYEGIVIYNPDSYYKDRRNNDWMRKVPVQSEDCIIIGFEEGEGKFKGSLGKVIISFKVFRVRVGTGFKERFWEDLSEKEKMESGMSEKTWNNTVRQYIWNNQDKFLYKTGQFEYKEKTKAGSMRQPRFKRWRFDKD